MACGFNLDWLAAKLQEPGYGVVENGVVRHAVPGVTPGQGQPTPPRYAPPGSLPDDMLELPFMEESRRLAEAQGWTPYHTYSSKKSDEGFPDLVLVRGRAVVWIECKEHTRVPTEKQTIWLHLLTYAGQE